MSRLLLLATLLIAVQASGYVIELEKVPKHPKPKFSRKTPAIVDARSALDFGFNRVEGSSPIRWQDYAQVDETSRGLLDPDHGLLARKLRLLGVAPDRPVVVLGPGLRGQGEEGRVAWMLSFLGVKKVSTTSYDTFKGRRTDKPWDGVLSAPIWLPQVNENLRILKKDLQSLLSDKKTDMVLIDVRPTAEFEGKEGKLKKLGHIPGSINLPWTEFLDESGNLLTHSALKQKLSQKNIDLKKSLIFISNQGVRSALATFAAHQAGLKARNFDGGLVDWGADASNPIVQEP